MYIQCLQKYLINFYLSCLILYSKVKLVGDLINEIFAHIDLSVVIWMNRIGSVMVSVLASSAVDLGFKGFKPLSGQT